jgi:RimJ/RimL family protein N-acetyltransferase
MSLEGMLLRKVLIDDRDDIYQWRNDEVTRKNSFNGELISYEEHCRWFKEALEDSQKILFVGVDEDDEKCGIIRFDSVNDFASEIHVNIAPEKRGRGIGATLIEESCKLFFTETRLKLVYARIIEQNKASIKVFLKTGFREMFRCIEEVSGSKIIVMALVNFN